MEEMVASSFWGPVTSTTESCEVNYAHSSYIAEFYNTISSLPCILLALVGLVNALRQRFEKRFSVLHLSNMTLAIGSVLFHATLQRGCLNFNSLMRLMVLPTFFQLALENTYERDKSNGKNLLIRKARQQQSDETPMVWEMLLYLYVLYSPDWHYRSTMPTFLFLYGSAFAIFHSWLRFNIGFKVHYVLLCLLCVPRMYKYYIRTKELPAKRLAHLYVVTIIPASLFWLVDRIFCKQVSKWVINPQGHALWHILMGFNSYFANAFLMFCRAQHLDWSPQIRYLFGFLPYVKINKPKTQ